MPRPENTFILGTPAVAAEVNENFSEIWAVPNIYGATAGEIISGATLPVPVYIDTSDGEVYACDADDTSKLMFAGFAVTDGIDGGDIDVQTSGLVQGFSGLTVGVYYFLQDTVGTIGANPGENLVCVGRAVSDTEIKMEDNTYGNTLLELDNTSENSGNITVKTLIKTITVPAYTLGPNNAIRLTVGGRATTSSGSPQITAEVESTEVANTGSFGNNGSGDYCMVITIVGDGDTSSQKSIGVATFKTTSGGELTRTEYTALSEDSTADIDISIYGNSVDSENATCYVHFVLVEKINR